MKQYTALLLFFMCNLAFTQQQQFCHTEDYIDTSGITKMFEPEDFIPNDSSAIIYLNIKVNVPRQDTLENFHEDSAAHVKFIHDVINVYLEGLLTKLDTPLFGGAVNTPYNGGPIGEPHLADTRIRINFDTTTDLAFFDVDSLESTLCDDQCVYEFRWFEYGQDKHCKLNIFLLESITNSTFGGVGHQEGVLMRNTFSWAYDRGPWTAAPLILHEIGHIFGLRHAPKSSSSGMCQYDDIFCGDSLIWCSSQSDEFCSNNVMSYSNMQRWLSPLQIGKFRLEAVEFMRKNNYAEIEGGPESMNVDIDTNTTWMWAFSPTFTGDLRIKSGAKLTIEGGPIPDVSIPIFFCDTCKIIVERGAILEIEKNRTVEGLGSTKCFGKRRRWGGIYVLGNSAKAQNFQTDASLLDSMDNGIVILGPSVTVRDAYTGISTRNPHKSGPTAREYYGGLIRVNGSVFHNNRRAVEFLKYDFKNISSFKNTTFRDSAYFLETPNNNSVGVTMWDCSNILFDSCHFYGFDVAGITGINYDMTVQNGCVFKECKNGIEAFYTSMDTEDGITIDGEETPNSFIGKNDADTLENGHSTEIAVWIEGGGGHQIIANDFLNVEYGVINAGRNISEITDNIFEKNSGFSNDMYGTAIIGGGLLLRDVQCNSYINNEIGIIALQENDLARFLGNDFDGEGSEDILVAGVGLQGSIAEIQGTTDLFASNCFSPDIDVDDQVNADANNTTVFTYYEPQAGQEDTCFYPVDNLSDGGDNNYYSIFPGGARSLIDCTLHGGIDSIVGNEDDHSNLLDYIDSLKLITNPDIATKTLLQDKQIEERALFYHIVTDYSSRDSFDSLKTFLAANPSVTSAHLYINTLYKQGDTTTIDNYQASVSSGGDSLFSELVDLLDIYDDYLRWDYVPDSASISDVYSLAESYEKNSHYARALLLLLHDVRIGYGDVTNLLPRSEQKSATNSVKKALIFYPNPTSNILYRNTEVTLVSDMVLYSLDGRVLGVYDKKQEHIDLSYQMAGIYFLQYQTSEGLKVHKIIKN